MSVENIKKTKNINYIIKKAFNCVVMGFILTVLSAFMPIMVTEAAQLDAMKFGWPIPFIIQSTQSIPPTDWFPNYAAPKYFLYDTNFLFINLLFSLLINIFIIFVLYFILVLISKAIKNLKTKHEK